MMQRQLLLSSNTETQKNGEHKFNFCKLMLKVLTIISNVNIQGFVKFFAYFSASEKSLSFSISLP